MDLIKYMTPESILIETAPIEKKELLSKLCMSLRHSPALKDEPESRLLEVLDAVLEREKVMPTGLGGGFAFPHARLKFLRRPAVALAVLRHPINFGASDEQPSNIISLVIAPESNPTIALKIMAQCCRAFGQIQTREAIETATDPQVIHDLVGKIGIELDVAITARDIMREPIREVHVDTPLRQVTEVMTKYHLAAVAVVTDEQRIVGHITCARLFNFGLPDFFAQLKSVSFIREFDPFEKYFFEEAHSKARDIMTTDFMAVAPDATLLEIVFALTTLRQPKLYVAEGGILKGVIDQGSVLDQIINF